MSSAFSSWEERPEKLLRHSDPIGPRAGHPTATWIKEQGRLADSLPVTKELDQFGVPMHASRSTHDAGSSSSRPFKSSMPPLVDRADDEEEPIGMLLGPSKQFRVRKDSHSSVGSSVLPPPLLGPGARYAANGSSYPSRGSKIGRTVYPSSNHSGAAQSLRQLPVQQQQRLTSSRSSAFDLDDWLRNSQTAAPPTQSFFPTSPSMQLPGSSARHDRSGRNTTFSEAGSRKGNRYNASSVSGLSAGVLSAGPESPRSRRKANSSLSKRSGFSNLDPHHPAFAASQELGMDAESRHIDTIEEWRAKSTAEPVSLDSHTRGDVGFGSTNGVSRSRRSSLKANLFPVHDAAPPMPEVPPVYADSVASTARRRKLKSPTHPTPLPSATSMAFSDLTAVKTPSALRELFSSGTSVQQDTPARTFIRWLVKENLKSAILPVILLMATLVRWLVGRGVWSGRGVAPLYGDFEAQRHWIELTSHLPVSDWYFYDLQYWGLDYPPLTAWVSLACGRIAALFPLVQSGFAFETSRGNEDEATVLFMRSSALICELLFYTPAIAMFLLRRLEGRGRRTQAVAFLSVIMQPALILIDHGHFQYNSVMLGFATACFALLYTTLPIPANAGAASSADMPPSKRNKTVVDLSRRLSYGYVAAAVFFCLSLSFKQMALYYAPAVFAVMLGRCIGLAQTEVERGLTLFIGLGLAVVTTFGVIFAPWLRSLTQIRQVVHRIFPLARGLFEDKVSNLWCFLSVLPIPQRYKLKNLLEASSLARLSLLTTLIAILPACWMLFWAASQTAKMEMTVAQDIVTHRQRSDSIASSVANSTTNRKKSRHRSTSVAGSIAGMGAMSEIESLLAGSVSKSRNSVKPAVDLTTTSPRPAASTLPSPAAQMLPYGLVSVSCAFFLFGFQTHEKSILLPLLPMTLLIGAKGDTWAGTTTAARDWAWAVWFNNVATFSLFPLLSKDGQGLQYLVLTLAWNWLIGNIAIPVVPTKILSSVVSSLIAPSHATVATLSYTAIATLHLLELLLPTVAPALHAASVARYPDLYPVLNVLLTTPCFMLVYCWALKRQVEVAFSNGFTFSLRPRYTASRKIKTV